MIIIFVFQNKCKTTYILSRSDCVAYGGNAVMTETER